MNKLIPSNAVSSFFFYMWNAWDEEECKIVFKNDFYLHFWTKWCSLVKKDAFGATEKFFSELSENNRELLVNRAVEVHDGRAKRKIQTPEKHLEILHTDLKNNLIDVYETVKQVVTKHGGIILTQDANCDTIYSIEYLSLDEAEVVERTIVGVRVKNNDLQIFSKDNNRSCRVEITEEDLINPEFEDQWVTLKNSCSVLFVPTLVNIAENIIQFI